MTMQWNQQKMTTMKVEMSTMVTASTVGNITRWQLWECHRRQVIVIITTATNVITKISEKRKGMEKMHLPSAEDVCRGCAGKDNG